MDERIAKIRTAAQYIRGRLERREPLIGIVLGSGLGELGDLIEEPIIIPYGEIPGFPLSTAIGHKGNLICGTFAGRCVLAMQGRFHYYEGYSMEMVTLPIRVMHELGVQTLVVSCAVGAVNQSYAPGDIMIIKDHISLLPNPLIGPNMEELGPRFPDMTCPYDLSLQKKALSAGEALGYHLRSGVLLSCTGPCYETPAEYKFFRTVGADVVSMSTTPEVIVARHMGLKVLGISVITDVAHDTDDDYVTDGELIVEMAEQASHKMTTLLEQVLQSD